MGAERITAGSAGRYRKYNRTQKLGSRVVFLALFALAFAGAVSGHGAD